MIKYLCILLINIICVFGDTNMFKEIKDNCPEDIDVFFEEQYNNVDEVRSQYEVDGCNAENDSIKEICKLEDFHILGAHVLFNLTKLDIQQLELVMRKVCEEDTVSDESNVEQEEIDKIEL